MIGPALETSDIINAVDPQHRYHIQKSQKDVYLYVVIEKYGLVKLKFITYALSPRGTGVTVICWPSKRLEKDRSS